MSQNNGWFSIVIARNLVILQRKRERSHQRTIKKGFKNGLAKAT
jgi:hypothetical protein